MPPKIFLTGATGYIGGSVFHNLTTSHPEYEFTVLLRTIPAGFSEKYPNVVTILGDFDSASILSTAASEANIVIFCGNSNHTGAITALLSGLSLRTTPSFLLHLSGTATISDVFSPSFVPGVLNPKIWSDVSDLSEICKLPDIHLHRPGERLVFSAAKTHGEHIHTAIISPGKTYGLGTGPGKTQSYTIPFFVGDIPKFGNRPFVLGEGENCSVWSYIGDVTGLFQRLVEEAAAGGAGAEWGENGFYFTPIHDDGIPWKSIAKATGKILKELGVIEDETPVSATSADTDKMLDGSGQLGLLMYGSNYRIRADRARKLFGLEAEGPWVLEVLKDDLGAAVKDKQRDVETLVKLLKG
ncbi:NAD(P)-binding protein [Trichophaea hybrida]|nr:NAD(P)-binding protein [Trichophaea hybrida]